MKTNRLIKALRAFLPIFLFVMMAWSPLIGSSQSTPFTFEKKGIFKHRTAIKMCGFELSQEQLLEFMAEDPAMDDYTRPLAGLFLTKTILNTTGSILSTFPLIQLQLDKEPNLNLTYAGLATLFTSAVLNKLYTNKAIKAARFYNNGYREPNTQAKFELRPSSNGLGLVLAF